MIPVSTSGMLVCGALAPSCLSAGAAPNRWALVMAARSTRRERAGPWRTVGQDHGGLHAEGDREDPGRNPWPIAQQPRAPAITRRKSFEPGSGVHGLTSMSVIVVLEAPRERVTAHTPERSAPGAAAQSYGCGACALKRLFLQE
jgi:hypothetical protein